MASLPLIASILCFTLLATAAANTAKQPDKDNHPQYSFSYNVHDPLTGDSKSQVETRTGDLVQGQYSLDDPDGTRRTVDYTADAVSGFNAVVRKTPIVRGVALVEPKLAVSGLGVPDLQVAKTVPPSFVSMPYSVAQLLFLRAHVPETWFLNVVPHFYFY